MHLKDGTPARPGDIIKTPDGKIGVIVGGNSGADTCNLEIVRIGDASNIHNPTQLFAGAVRTSKGEIAERVALGLWKESCLTAADCERLGHVDIGNDG